MGASNAGASGSDAGFTNTPTRSKVTKVRDPNPIKSFIKGGGVTGAVVRGIGSMLDKAKTNIANNKANNSAIGTADYQGSKKKNNVAVSNNNDRDNNQNQIAKTVAAAPVIKKNIGGNEIQTTQAKIDQAAELTPEQILLKTKKRGRSQSIMTSSQGVTKTSSDYSLGKSSLLGRI